MADLDHDADKVFVKHHPAELGRPSPSSSIGYAYPNGNAIGGPLDGRGPLRRAGADATSTRRPARGCRRSTGRTAPTAWSSSVDPETGEFEVLPDRLGVRRGQGDQPRVGAAASASAAWCRGWAPALCEGYIFDEQGRLLNPSFTDNKIPTAKDMPVDRSRARRGDRPARRAVRRAGRRRAPDDLGRPAIGNAIPNATAVEFFALPLDPERVYLALKHAAERKPALAGVET